MSSLEKKCAEARAIYSFIYANSLLQGESVFFTQWLFFTAAGILQLGVSTTGAEIAGHLFMVEPNILPALFIMGGLDSLTSIAYPDLDRACG